MISPQVLTLPQIASELDFYVQLHSAAQADDYCPVPRNLDGLHDLVRGLSHSVTKVQAPGLANVVQQQRFFLICHIFLEHKVCLSVDSDQVT